MPDTEIKSRLDTIISEINRLAKEGKELESKIDNDSYFKDAVLSTIEELYDVEIEVW